MEKREKIIDQKYIIKKFHAVRHACKALEHLNKHYKSKDLADNYDRVHNVGLFDQTLLIFFLGNKTNICF